MILLIMHDISWKGRPLGLPFLKFIPPITIFLSYFNYRIKNLGRRTTGKISVLTFPLNIMDKKIVLKLRPLRTTSEMEQEENIPAISPAHDTEPADSPSGDLCNLEGTWPIRWKKKQDYAMAGISNDGVIAIAGLTLVRKALGISSNEFALFVKKFLCIHFTESNVLSCRFGDTGGNIYCHFLVYPLKNRQLTPDPWIDPRSQKLKSQIMDEFLDTFGKEFGIKFTTSGENNGHTEYLDKFPRVVTTKEDCQEIFYTTITEESQMQTDYPKDRIQSIINQTIKYFTTGVEKGAFIKLNAHDITVSQYLHEVQNYLLRMYPDISERDTGIVIKKVRSAAVGFYILDDLINDPRISDIKIVSPHKLRVKVDGNRRTSNLQFIDADDYYRFLDGIIMRYGLDPDEEIHVFTDTESNDKFILRNNITLSGINSGYPVFHIRKIPKTKYTIEDLITFGVLDETTANYLIWAAREARGIVFTGKGSSGKTTLMNTLLEYISSNSAGKVIQESEELFSNKPEITFEHIIPGYDLKELAKNGLLTDIDYFIIGEVKGEEAMYFINACDTGNKAWCSVHSPNSREAINKLADYVMYASKYSHNEALYMLRELQVIVFMKNFQVAEISEVTGWNYETKELSYRTVFRRDELFS